MDNDPMAMRFREIPMISREEEVELVRKPVREERACTSGVACNGELVCVKDQDCCILCLQKKVDGVAPHTNVAVLVEFIFFENECGIAS